MKIVIDNSGYGLDNMGDVAMLQVAILRLRQLLPKASLNVLSNAPELLKDYCPEAKVLSPTGRGILMQPWNIFGKGRHLVPAKYHCYFTAFEQVLRTRYPKYILPWITYRLQRCTPDIELMHDFWKVFQEADLVISTGGGYINDSFPRHAKLVLQTLQQAQAMGKPTALLGQGIGPLNGNSLRRLAGSVLPHVDLIGLRENKLGAKLLKKMNVPEESITTTGDDAIELVSKYKEERKGRNVGVNIRLSSYSHVSPNHVAIIRATIQRFCYRLEVGLQPIPISYAPVDTDIGTLYSHFNNLLPISKELKGETRATPQAIVKAVSNCRIVVTGSYHAGVFALSQGVPVVGLSASSYYVAKFSGLKRQFGGGVEQVFLDDENFEQQFQSALQRAWDSAEKLWHPLQKAALTQVDTGRVFYSRVANLLEQKKQGGT